MTNGNNPLFWILAVVLILINIFADIVELVANLISLTVVGSFVLFISSIIGGSISFMTSLLLIVMGGIDYTSIAKKIAIYLVSFLAELIPGISFLPLRTISVFIVIMMMVAEARAQRFVQEQGEKSEEGNEQTESSQDTNLVENQNQ
ncbi:MAG: hypothetical protein NZ822_00845 [Patescibacteria group bacterium]|nr:hypothetical protein [Patescibacteria group bacterium]